MSVRANFAFLRVRQKPGQITVTHDISWVVEAMCAIESRTSEEQLDALLFFFRGAPKGRAGASVLRSVTLEVVRYEHTYFPNDLIAGTDVLVLDNYRHGDDMIQLSVARSRRWWIRTILMH